MRVAVILLTYDGVKSWYCGVGSISQYFINAIPKVSKHFKKKNIKISFFVGIPHTSKGCLGYRKDLERKVHKIVKKTGGEILNFTDNSNGISQYGTLKQWKAASIGAASMILNLMNKFDKIIVYGFDTPYCQVGRFVSKQLSNYKGQKPIIIWTPHSTGLIHEIKSKKHSKKRYNWEKSAIEDAKKYKNCYIGYINEFMKKHIIKKFNGSSENLIPLINGVINLIKKGKSPNWVKGKNLVFATGRAEKYKGFKYLIKAFATSQKDHSAFLLLLLSTSTSYAPNLIELKKLMKKYKVRGKIIEDFINLKELAAIFNNPNILSVVIPSIGEPFGLLPEEARLYSHIKGPILILSDTGGLSEQINEGEDGYLVDVTNIKKFAKLLTKITKITDKRKKELVLAGKKHCKKNYSYDKNIIHSLEKFIY